MVPGQVITQETIDFMRKLDVKEIHGYDAAEGLKLVRADALAKRLERYRSGRLDAWQCGSGLQKVRQNFL
jgi:arginine decarboxylase